MVDFNIFGMSNSDNKHSKADGDLGLFEETVMCELCTRQIPLLKYEQHINYFCQNKMAECHKCFESYPNSIIHEHLKVCAVGESSSSQSDYEEDDGLIQCVYCGARMSQVDWPDHNIAHKVH